MDADPEDLRVVELSSLQAIFPEIQLLGGGRDNDPIAFKLDVPVNPATPVTVTFPAVAAVDVAAVRDVNGNAQHPVDSHELAFLPSLVLDIVLPEKYPALVPPRVSISTSPQWLPADTISRLEGDCARLWKEMGCDMIAFSYIDHVQQAADDVFGLVDATRVLEVDSAHKIAILDYDIKARRAAFEKETYECGICLDPKKGSACHKLLDCGHVFCARCLQDFYNDAITQGNLRALQCLTPGCAKERSQGTVSPGSKRRKPRTYISPSELLQIGLSEGMAKRYVTLKYKTELESDKNTVYCPRTWCGGAARSKKHKPPEGLELREPDDEEEDKGSDDDEDAASKSADAKGRMFSSADLLAVCESCGYAFCSRCQQSWHGEFVFCLDRRDNQEMSTEEKASVEYLHLHTTPCPTCSAPAQKTNGCNHMICFCCDSHFCYLCSAWLDPTNPYQHFNKASGGKVTSCYMRLWELEDGDGDDVGLGFAGGAERAQPQPRPRNPQQQPQPQPAVINIIPEIEEPDDDDDDDDEGVDDGQQAGGAHLGVAREGPLVLRIAAEPLRPRAPIPPPAPAAPVRGGGRGGHGAHAGAQRGRGNMGAGPRGGRGGHRGDHRQRNGEAAARQPNLAGGGQVRRLNGVDEQGDMDPNQAAWIRRFVELALRDEEDDMDDSDDE